MKHMLVVNVNWVGDVIFSVPVFKALKKRYPQARISCMAAPRVVGVLRCVPHIDEIIIYDERGRHASLPGKIRLIFELRRKAFDAAFVLHRSLTRALLVFLAGIPCRVGYEAKRRGIFLTHSIALPSTNIHRSDYYSRLLEAYGISVDDKTCDFHVPQESRDFIEKLWKIHRIENGRLVVALSVGGNWNLKRWPKENYARLIDGLCEQYGAQVILAGAPDDIVLCGEVMRAAAHKPLLLAGQTTLTDLVALIEKVDVFISADTGPLHIASGVGTKSIALFGPTRPEITGPRGKGAIGILQHDVGCNRSACYNLTCPDNICMQSIAVAEVLDGFRRLGYQKDTPYLP